MRLKKKICGIMLSFVLVLGLMPGMSMIAQASTEETLLTTVTYTNGGSQTHSPEGVVTVTLNGVTFNDNTYGWLFFESGTVTVAPVDGVEITKVRFRQNGKNPVDDDLAPFTLTFNEGEGSVETSTGTVYAGSMDGVTSIEVYRSETIEEYTVTYKVVNGTWDGTSTADKTETVASGGKPASVPTGMKANSGYTGGSWDTDPSTATISADTTFTYTFVADSSSGGDSSDSGNSGSSDSGSTSGGSSDSGSSSGSSSSSNTSSDTSSSSSSSSNTSTSTSTTAPATVPYENVVISTGAVNDITGTAAATAESNPFGTKIENNDNLTTLLALTPEEVAQGVNVWLDIQDMSATVPQADKDLVQSASNDFTVGMYLDINLFKKVGGNAATKITETNGTVKASILIPESLWKAGRTFEIIRVHDGVPTVISGTYDENTHVFTFETDKFSTYALAYNDSAVAGSTSNSTQSSAPRTGDNNHLGVWYLLLAVSLGGLGFLAYSKKRKVNK